MYIIKPSKCTNCGDCLDECPMAAIFENPDGNFAIEPDTCTDCGSCADICPEDATRGA